MLSWDSWLLSCEQKLIFLHYIVTLSSFSFNYSLWHCFNILMFPQVKVVIVDSVTFHFRQDFDDMALRTRLLSGLALKLMKLAKNCSLSVRRFCLFAAPKLVFFFYASPSLWNLNWWEGEGNCISSFPSSCIKLIFPFGLLNINFHFLGDVWKRFHFFIFCVCFIFV